MCFEHVGWDPFVGLVALRNSDVTDVRTYFGETDPANIPYFDEDGCSLWAAFSIDDNVNKCITT